MSQVQPPHRLQRLRSALAGLIFNNRNDWVVKVEDVRHADVQDGIVNHLERDFTGGTDGHGHKANNYATYLRDTDDPAVTAWLERAGDLYASGGVAYSVNLPDIRR